MRLRPFLTLALVAGGLFASAGRSEAAFTISFSGSNLPGGTVTITDNVAPSGFGFPGDGNATSNIIVFSFDGDPNNPGVTYSASGTVRLQMVGSALRMSLNTFTFSNTTSNGTPVNFEDLTITVQATDLSFAASTMRSSLLVSSGVSGVPYSLTTSISNAASSNTAVSVPATFPATAVNTTTFVNPIPLYTLTSVYTIETVAAGTTFSLNGSFSELSPTPAPTTLLAAIGCIPVLGFVGALRRRTAKAAVAA